CTRCSFVPTGLKAMSDLTCCLSNVARIRRSSFSRGTSHFRPLQSKNALMQRRYVFTDIAATPRCLNSAMRVLSASELVSAPSNALKLSLYHARVLGVTFLRYFRSWMKVQAEALICSSFSYVTDSMGA